MTPRKIEGASYGEFWPNGFGFAVPFIPGGKDLLFVRVSQGAKAAGQGHQDGHAWEWDGAAWHDRGPCVGTNPVAYSGEDLYISREDGVYVNGVNVRPGYIGSQGIRWIDGAGIHSGDQTYSDGLVAEYTDCGGLRIGQGMSGGLVVRSGVNQYQLATGSVRFVRANRVGDALAIYYTDFTNGYLILTTAAEILALPPFQSPAPAPVPVPVPVPVPPPTPKDDTVSLDIVKAVRAKYPRSNPGGAPIPVEEAWMPVVDVAQQTGAFVFRKDAGDDTSHTFIPAGLLSAYPGGVWISRTIIGRGALGTTWRKVFGDGEGKAFPIWQLGDSPADGEYIDVREINLSGNPAPQPPPTVPPSVPPVSELEALKARMLDLEQWKARVQAGVR